MSILTDAELFKAWQAVSPYDPTMVYSHGFAANAKLVEKDAEIDRLTREGLEAVRGYDAEIARLKSDNIERHKEINDLRFQIARLTARLDEMTAGVRRIAWDAHSAASNWEGDAFADLTAIGDELDELTATDTEQSKGEGE